MAVLGSLKNRSIFGLGSTLLTLTVSVLLGRRRGIILADRDFSFLTCLLHSEAAKVNYLLGSVFLTATVSGEAEEML